MCEKNWQVERSSAHVKWVIRKKSKKAQGDKMQPTLVMLVFTAAPNNNTYHLHLQCTCPPITRSDMRILPPSVRHWARSRSRVSGVSNGWAGGADMTTREQALEDPRKAPLIWTSPSVHTAVFSPASRIRLESESEEIDEDKVDIGEAGHFGECAYSATYISLIDFFLMPL